MWRLYRRSGSQDKGDRLTYQPVNSCIYLVGQIDGTELVTIENLARDGRLHPMQSALATQHGSQCGFCTPGIVMSLFAHYHNGAHPSGREQINDALAGNLCRCTGYRTIVDAALKVCAQPLADHFVENQTSTLKALSAFDAVTDIFVGDRASFFAAPASEETLSALYEQHPDATLSAGATDVGLWITKNLDPIGKVIHLGRINSLEGIEETADTFRFGSGVSLERASAVLGSIDPDIGEVMRRFGSNQVRAASTMGGNIANGSPIGDLAPMLIALGTTIELRKGAATRTVRLQDFFLDYRKQDRAPGEFLRQIIVPKLRPGAHFRAFKISKRRDEDISAVLAAVHVELEGRRIASARVAFGGMAGIPKRALGVEKRLTGSMISDVKSWQDAAGQVDKDFTPLSDLRASGGYRLQVARNLIIKAMAEIAGTPSGTVRSGRSGGVSCRALTCRRPPCATCTKRCRTTALSSTCRAPLTILTICLNPRACLHVAIGGSPVARGTITAVDLSKVRAFPGVVKVITAADVPGRNDVSPATGDEPAFAELARRIPRPADLRRDRNVARGGAAGGHAWQDRHRPGSTDCDGRSGRLVW